MASHCHSHPFSFPLMPLSCMIILLISLNMSPCVNSFDYFSNCSSQFSCGNVNNVGFPFWGDGRAEWCGYPGFYLKCTASFTYITINSITYLVKEVYPDSHTLKIARVELLKELCPDRIQSTTLDILDRNLFDYIPGYQNLTLLYGCNVGVASNFSGRFYCPLYGYAYSFLGVKDPVLEHCKYSVVVPVRSTLSVRDASNMQAIGEAVEDGFEVKWIVGIEECNQCQQSGGVCGYDFKLNQTNCFCNGSDSGSRICSPLSTDSDAKAPQGSSLNGRILIAIGSSAGGTGLFIVVALIVCNRKKCLRKRGIFRDDNVEKFNDNVDKFMESYGSSAPRRYTYSEVKKMTNSFRNKLGEGGYGIVYKARLPLDGHLLAVKLLTESKGNGEEFINEVASIGRTSHVNIISLLGYCYEREKRALIYEFMPNGSLDKFIYKRGSPDATCNLEWKTMYQIAIGVARGLEYLHRGCNTRILHLDIKPQNILLDEDFCPKISDFGLAKICQNKESIVSIIGTRGTIGFIAPEVLSRTFGGVSHKSDVYSYGMLVLELVGGRKNYDNGGSHTSEMYFPDWIYKDLQQGNCLSRNMSITGEENEIVRKMVLVSLWCIQTNPPDRPSIGKVVEMLEGSIESLPFPPKPFLQSPPRSALQFSDEASSNMQDINSRTTPKNGSVEQSKGSNF